MFSECEKYPQEKNKHFLINKNYIVKCTYTYINTNNIYVTTLLHCISYSIKDLCEQTMEYH